MSAENAARRILQQAERADTEQSALEWFLGAEAEAAAAEVHEGPVLPDGSLWGLGALALAHADWFRYLAGNETDPGALGAALLRFVAVHEQDPDQVPHGIRPLFATLSGAPDAAATEPGFAYHAALGMTLMFQQTRHSGVLYLAETLLRHAATAFGEGSLEQGVCLSDLGLVLFYGFQEGAGHQALTDAVTACRAAVVCAPGVRDEQARRHGNLGHTLRNWAAANEDRDAMREAVAELRKAMELSTWNNPNRAQHSATLGSALCSAALHLADPALRSEGITLLRDTLAEPDAALNSRSGFLSDLGVALIQGALTEGDAVPYEEGIAACRESADTAPNPVERTLALANLSLLLAGHASRTHDPVILEDAHEAARDALDGAPAGHPLRAQAHLALSQVLNARHSATGSPEYLEEAIAHSRRGTECVPADDFARRVLHATNFADLLLKRGVRHAWTPTGPGSPTELRAPIALLRTLADELAPPSAGRARVLLALWHCLRTAEDADGVDRLIDCFRHCLALPAPADGFEPVVRFGLGAALAHRAGTDDGAWREGAEEMRRALDLFPAHDRVYWNCHSEYADILIARGDATSDVDLYEEALLLLREKAERAPLSRSERSLYRSNLAIAQVKVAVFTGRPELFTEAVATHREALATSAPEDFLHVQQCMSLGEALLALAEFCSDSEALREGIEVLRAAVAASDEDTHGGAACRTVLGEALRNLARLASDPAPLEESVRWHREALVMVAGPPAPVALLGLANSLGALYRYTRDTRHSGEAIHHFRAALAALRPATADLRGSILTSLGYTQWSQARHTGDERLMDTAVDTLREAVSHAPRARLSMALTNLGSALMDRSRRTGNRAWMAEAVTVLRRAVNDGLPSAMDRPLHLNNLAEALRYWDALIGDTSATDEAVELLRAAMAVELGDHEGSEGAVTNLASLLVDRAQANEDPHMLDEARRLLEEAVSRLGTEHPSRFFALQRLCMAWHLTAQVAEDPAGATARQARNRAAAAARESLAHTSESDPDHALSQLMLAVVQLERHEQGEQVDLAEVVRLARDCARNPAAHSTSRLQAAHVWGLASGRAGDRPEALEGYAYAVGLLPGIAPRSLARIDQEARLSGSDGLASDAAALALDAGDPHRALALLEQGRGVLLGQGLENRTDVSRLRDVDPARAAEFERIRDELSTPPPLSPAKDALDASVLAETRHALARRWSELLSEVRGLPGLANFLRPPSVPELVAAAAEGPVVVVNVSVYRCDALVVTADAGVAVVPLPGLTLDAVVTRAAEFIDGVETAYGGNGVDEAVAMMRTLSGTLGWLWDTIAAPVLGHLGLRAGPAQGTPWPRLWWCPTGWLSFLPLHAAGHGHPDSGTWVMDRAVSSYTPTLRALVRARAGLVTGTPALPSPLVVALPDTPGAAPLPGVAREAELLSELFPGARLMTGPDATVEAVGGALDAHPWVHFSCHGVSELLNPSESGLILYDGRLTVSDVATRRPVTPQLAMLSACSASQGGIELSDEAVQLASSFQLAGYPHVIGTLWPIADKLATHLTEAFYTALAEDIARGRPIDPAAALHHPVRALRDRYAQAPHLWAAHIHTGP
ncbi:CHAT domain-containing protein [Streptomyces sp. NBC_01336]|uniref:CHAT domain-containing protein n=1 Tax=Streptomyces sp. NBC_01336 TaxID=2903829 RepID=UPI002E152245|nr:CHAT domain-containing protein [Streptomyces sp. NBC_01336]